MTYDDHLEAADDEMTAFQLLARSAEFSSPVPTCPPWRVDELVGHVGYVWRWIAGLVSSQAPTRLSGKDLGVVRGPVTLPWLGEGQDLVLAALRAATPDAPMWAWGVDQHLRFWAWRIWCETLIHRLDLALASGHEWSTTPERAAEALDELIVNVPAAKSFSPAMAADLGNGEVVRLVATDVDVEWFVALTAHGLVPVEAGPAQVTLRSRAERLLVSAYQRVALSATWHGDTIDVVGTREVAERFAAATSLA